MRRIPGLAPVLRRIPGLAGRSRGPTPTPGPSIVLRGNLDAPAEVVLQRDTVLFRGWALAGSVSPAAVTVVVNGGRRVDAIVGTLRPDVPAYLNEPSSTPLCGWSAAVDLAEEPPGDLTIQVVVSHLDHHQVVADRLFALRGDGLTGSIDMPLDGSEIPGPLLAVRGWAHAVDGVARIDVYVDGEHVGPARIGLARPDVHDMTPTKYGVALGWERRCVLDEAGPPTHELAVTVTDRRGQTARLAGLTFTTRRHEISESDAELVPVLQERTGRAIAAIPDGRYRHRLRHRHRSRRPRLQPQPRHRRRPALPPGPAPGPGARPHPLPRRLGRGRDPGRRARGPRGGREREPPPRAQRRRRLRGRGRRAGRLHPGLGLHVGAAQHHRPVVRGRRRPPGRYPHHLGHPRELRPRRLAQPGLRRPGPLPLRRSTG